MAVTFDHAAIGQILKSADMADRMHKLAQQVADHVDVGDDETPVSVADYTTDRAISVIALAGPAGAAIQAKDGALTKAAAAVGLEVRSR